MKKIIAGILMIAMVLALAACGSGSGGGSTDKATQASGSGDKATEAQSADSSESGESKKITIGSTQKVTVPLDGANEANMFGFGICCDMLVFIDQNGEVKSDILESWETTDKGVTMTLKDGVTFTDGKEDLKISHHASGATDAMVI